MDAYRAGGAAPLLPPITASHIYARLMEVGPAEAGAMGQVPLGWSTILAWSDLTFIRLSAWEARLLRRLSVEYLAELHASEDAYRAAPWLPRAAEVDHDANERQLRAVLG